MKIVMLSGAQGSGKSSIAYALEKRLSEKNKQVVITKFASVIYEMHDEVLGVLSDYVPEKVKPKDGRLLQLLGSDWGRATLGENIWCDILKVKIKNYLHIMEVAIIDDCRFENEFNAFPEALRVRLNCPAEIRKERCSSWRDHDVHPSEIGLNDYSDKGFFDLYLETGTTSVDHCVELILAKLDKACWHAKRKNFPTESVGYF